MSKWDGRHSNYYGVQTESDDELCWNCEMAFTLNNAPADVVMHFCGPDCETEWWANQPLATVIEKHRLLRRADGEEPTN